MGKAPLVRRANVVVHAACSVRADDNQRKLDQKAGRR
jgi:hypothetical protein